MAPQWTWLVILMALLFRSGMIGAQTLALNP